MKPPATASSSRARSGIPGGLAHAGEGARVLQRAADPVGKPAGVEEVDQQPVVAVAHDLAYRVGIRRDPQAAGAQRLAEHGEVIDFGGRSARRARPGRLPSSTEASPRPPTRNGMSSTPLAVIAALRFLRRE